MVAVAALVSGCGGSPKLSPAQLLDAGVAAQAKGDLTKARSYYRKVLSKDPDNKAGLNKIAWFDLGVIDQTQGNVQAALTEYQQALVLDPKYVNALYNLAVLQTPTAPATAIQLYKQVIALSPRDPNAIYNLGLLLYRSGQVSQGRDLLLTALKIAPSLSAKLPSDVKLSRSPSPTPSPSP